MSEDPTRIIPTQSLFQKLKISGWELEMKIKAIFDDPGEIVAIGHSTYPIMKTVDYRKITLKQLFSIKFNEEYLKYLKKREPRFEDGVTGRIVVIGCPILSGVRTTSVILRFRKEMINILNDFITHGYSTDFISYSKIKKYKDTCRLMNKYKKYNYENRNLNNRRRLYPLIRRLENKLGLIPLDLPSPDSFQRIDPKVLNKFTQISKRF